MATRAGSVTAAFEREHRFFFITACIMALVLVAGFSTSLAFGRSSFTLPLLFHLHAFTFFGWVALYLLQTGLASTGSIRLHKQLGWLALGWVPAMVVLGTVLTLHSVRQTGAPFFFDKNEFLVGNLLGLPLFAVMVGAAIVLRRRTDWHRRMMLCAMASITGPGFGRLLPMPFLIPWAWWLAAVLFPSLFIIAGMIADRRRTGRVHAAYFWGLGLLVGTQILVDVIAYSPVGYAMTEAVTAGYPGAARPMRAHFP